MAQQHRVSGRSTAIFMDADGYTNVVYHSTAVVRFNDKLIILNNGGWKTATTKTRMNQASSQFGLGFSVIQRDYKWFVDYAGKQIEFEHGIVLNRENEK